MSVGVIALPRDRNPYQELLYSRLRERGHRVTYAGELTRSQSLNLLLLPAELVWLRLCGYRVLHLHWVFKFAFTGGDRHFRLRRLSRSWFAFTLRVARASGLRIVWTAHNLLPHGRVFDDDGAARRLLVSHADLVIAHTQATLEEVSARFGRPASAVVIPHGPIEPPGLGRTPPLAGTDPRSILCFGTIEAYKGIDDLLTAVRELGPSVRVQVVGRCRDDDLARELQRRAEKLSAVTLSLGFVAEAEIAPLFAAVDAVVFPYRRVTTSGSVTLAAVAGRPIIVPDLPGFAEIPDAAVIRYPPGVDGLRRALEQVAVADPETLRRKGAAARDMLSAISWDAIAETTSRELERVCG